VLANKVKPVGGMSSSEMMMRRLGHERASNCRRVRLAIDLMMGQDMPDDHQQFTSDCGNGFLFTNPFGERTEKRPVVAT
jgi:hypothetical protein